MTDVLSGEISKFIAAAEALGAPLFDLDTLLAGAKVLEARRDDIIARFVAGEFRDDSLPFSHIVAPTEKIDNDLDTISAGARAAFAFVASRYLPEALSSDMADITDGPGKLFNDALLAGFKIALREIRAA